MGLIYRAIFPNNKSYIGQTTQKLEKRIQQHKASAKKDKNKNYFHSACLKYGWENIKWVILEECDNLLLNEKEQYWIQYYNTYYIYRNGYNMTLGGDSQEHCRLFNDSSSVKKLVEEYKECGSISALANKYQCSYNAIYNTIALYEKTTEEDIIKKYRKGLGKYTKGQVDEILVRAKNQSCPTISKEMGVPIKFVQDILAGRSWRWYTGLTYITRDERQSYNPVNSKWTKEEIMAMVRDFYVLKLSTTEIHKKYNINLNRLYEILKGKTWKEITGCTLEQYEQEIERRGKKIEKLTSQKVLDIVSDFNSGKSKQEIETKYNVNRNIINRILSGDRWSGVTGIKKIMFENPQRL